MLKENAELKITLLYMYIIQEIVMSLHAGEHTCGYYLGQKELHLCWLHLQLSEGSQRK